MVPLPLRRDDILEQFRRPGVQGASDSHDVHEGWIDLPALHGTDVGAVQPRGAGEPLLR